MLDSDPYPLAVKGSPVTEARIEDARACLRMLQSLNADVQESAHRLVPPSTGAWRSAAADGYAQALDRLRTLVIGTRDQLADAERALIDRIRRMEEQFAIQQAALGLPTSTVRSVQRTDASWATH
ncbi:hypothetical protein ACWGST_07470 [Agromyces sp. NPDC055520]